MARYRLLVFLIVAGFAALSSLAQTKTSAKATAKAAPKPRIVPAEEIRWGGSRDATPRGSRVAILYGNPDASSGGHFVMRVKASDGASVGPQWHASDVHLTVLQGSIVFGEGAAFDERKARTLGPGGYVLVPRGLRYTVQVRGESEYQIQGNAPLKTYVVKAAPVAAAKVSPEEQKQKAEFDAAMAAYNQAFQARDQAALQGPVKKEFERIAGGGGRYAAQAREFLSTRLAPEIRTASGCPAIPALRDPGWVVQDLKPGDVVATGLLEPKLTWMHCPAPQFPHSARAVAKPGVVRLAVTLDESGNVTNVKARGGLYPPGYLEAAMAAVHLWKTNPPRVKSIPVRTEISLDIPYND